MRGSADLPLAHCHRLPPSLLSSSDTLTRLVSSPAPSLEMLAELTLGPSTAIKTHTCSFLLLEHSFSPLIILFPLPSYSFAFSLDVTSTANPLYPKFGALMKDLLTGAPKITMYEELPRGSKL